MARYGQCYVLKLRRGKWYVGYTEKGVERILDHIDAKGAKWTRTYPPLKNGYLQDVTPTGKSKATPKNKPNSDEDKLTLKLMKKHGIQNVRGGSWCMVKMRQKTIRELESLISKAKPSKKKAKQRVVKGYCIRCGDRKKFDALKPLCRGCYDEWAFYSNPDYEEDCCHKCGRDWGTTIDRPLCTSCWRKSS